MPIIESLDNDHRGTGGIADDQQAQGTDHDASPMTESTPRDDHYGPASDDVIDITGATPWDDDGATDSDDVIDMTGSPTQRSPKAGTGMKSI
jgi:hypothetical protein